MRGGYAAGGLILVGAGFATFAWQLSRFGVRTAPVFAIASLAAVSAAIALRLRKEWAATLSLALIAALFLWLQATRPSFSLTLGTLGNLLLAAGTATAAFGLRSPGTKVAPMGWLIAAVGGLAFLPGNLEAGAAFLVAGILATLGFALAAMPLVTSSGTPRDPAPE